MSLLKKIGKVIRKVAKPVLKVGQFIPGPIGTAARVVNTVKGAVSATRSPRLPAFQAASYGVQPMSMVAGLPAIVRGVGAIGGAVRTLPGIGRIGGAVGGAARVGGVIARNPAVRKWTRRAAEAAGYAVIGKAIYDSAGNKVGNLPGRRINPLNARALNRAMRRVCAAKNICERVDEITTGKKRRKRGAC